MKVQTTISPSALTVLKTRAQDHEKKLYEDLGKYNNQPYSPQNLALLIQALRQNYVNVTELKITPKEVMQGAKDKDFEDSLSSHLLGEDALMITHRKAYGNKALGISNLIDRVRDEAVYAIRRGYANEIIENILARAVGQELSKQSGNSNYIMSSTANELYSSHVDTRLADIELEYIDKDGLESSLKFDAKYNLNKFHITEINDLSDRLKWIDEPYGPINSYHETAKLIRDVLQKSGGLKLLSQEEIHLGGNVYDLKVTYGLDPIQAGDIAALLLKDKYGDLMQPLIFTSYQNNQEVKTFSQVLEDLSSGSGYLDYSEVEGGSTFSVEMPSDKQDALDEVKDYMDKMINHVALWYGRK